MLQTQAPSHFTTAPLSTIVSAPGWLSIDRHAAAWLAGNELELRRPIVFLRSRAARPRWPALQVPARKARRQTEYLGAVVVATKALRRSGAGGSLGAVVVTAETSYRAGRRRLFWAVIIAAYLADVVGPATADSPPSAPAVETLGGADEIEDEQQRDKRRVLIHG